MEATYDDRSRVRETLRVITCTLRLHHPTHAQLATALAQLRALARDESAAGLLYDEVELMSLLDDAYAWRRIAPAHDRTALEAMVACGQVTGDSVSLATVVTALERYVHRAERSGAAPWADYPALADLLLCLDAEDMRVDCAHLHALTTLLRRVVKHTHMDSALYASTAALLTWVPTYKPFEPACDVMARAMRALAPASATRACAFVHEAMLLSG